MGQDGQSDDNGNMIMGQSGMSGNMVGGQSLDEIVSMNAKAMRRQSMPHQFGGNQNTMPTDMRRISMMDYGSGSPAGSMGNFHFDPNAGISQGGMMSEDVVTTQGQGQQGNHTPRQSQGDLSLNTSFANAAQNYNAMMAPNTYQSPAQHQTNFDMTMSSPYIDSGMNMQMDYNVDQNLGNSTAGDATQMNMYQQPQFTQTIMSSPMHPSGSRSAHSTSGQQQDAGGPSSMSSSYAGTSHGSKNTMQNASRAQSLHVADSTSPHHSGDVTPMSQPSAGAQREYSHGGFSGQPQHPRPGSVQDRGMQRSMPSNQNVSQVYDGVNGPLPVNASNYNPNNQGFDWSAGEQGWPSTMVGRPHMQTSYKNAYSSSGFDMLGVLVRAPLVLVNWSRD